MGEVSINLNNKVKVKLTTHGIYVYNSFYGDVFRKDCSLDIDENGYSEMQLHEFITIYGSYFPFRIKEILQDMNLVVAYKV